MKDKLIGLFILLMGLTLAWTGATEYKESSSAKAPVALTWPQFLAQKPESGWFKVSGAQLEVTDALWVEDIVGGEMDNVYVPARAANNENLENSPIEMLVKIDDADIVATVKELKQLDKGTDEAAMQYVLSHEEQLIIQRPLVGTLAEGFDAVDSDDEKAIRRAEVSLASDFVILQENVKPDVGGRIFMLLGGIGLALLGLFYIFKKPATPATPALPATPPPSPTNLEPPLSP